MYVKDKTEEEVKAWCAMAFDQTNGYLRERGHPVHADDFNSLTVREQLTVLMYWGAVDIHASTDECLGKQVAYRVGQVVEVLDQHAGHGEDFDELMDFLFTTRMTGQVEMGQSIHTENLVATRLYELDVVFRKDGSA